MRRSRALYPSLVAAVALLAFGVVVTFGFAYDDAWTIVGNHWLERPLVEILFLLASGEAATRFVPDATRPVMVLGHWLERRVYGLSPWGYHLDSLLLYALVCALATHVAWLWCRRRDTALFTGCFFALAPLQAEVVASINYREDLYAAAGTLLVLALLFRPARTPFGRIPARKYDSGTRALAVAAAFAFALFGKESAITLVPLVAVAAYCLPAAAESLRASRRAKWALGGTFTLWLLWRVPLFLHGRDLPLAPKRSLAQMLLRTARFEVLAVRNALFPVFWSPDHWRQIDATFSWFVPFLSLVAAVVVLGKAPPTRQLALGIGVALVAPLGACPLLRPINELTDRYFLLSVLGGGLIWAWGAARLAERARLGRARRYLPLVCGLWLWPLWRAVRVWKDDRTLWTATTQMNPASARAWTSLSQVHRIAREQEAADRTMERALDLVPDYLAGQIVRIHNDLAFGRLAEAREHIAEVARRGYRDDEGEFGREQRCVKLDADAAALCIGP